MCQSPSKERVDTMILAIAATQLEMDPFVEVIKGAKNQCVTLVGGVGPVETALRLTQFLAKQHHTVDLVVSFGIGGAYINGENEYPGLLDICLAESEIAGDFGICMDNSMQYFEKPLSGGVEYRVSQQWLYTCGQILIQEQIDFYSGTFITVNSVSGTKKRGDMLQRRWNGLCENMEGAAVARVCREFGLPFVELRSISNLVEDRNPASWKLREACVIAAETTAILIKGIEYVPA